MASNQPLAQPKGSVSRDSNLILTSRGALTPCDGSAIINWLSGAVQTTDGKILAETLFDPTAVSPYYLAIKQQLDQPLGAPQDLTAADAGAGGTLGAGTYFYEVTALDGAGGETTASNEASQLIAANHKILLTWNVVPNAFGYNVYRSTGSGGETLLVGANIPVLQPSPLTLTVTFTDDGTDTTGTTFAVTSGFVDVVIVSPGTKFFSDWVVPSTAGLMVGQVFTYTPGTNVHFAITWQITGITSGTAFTATHFGAGPGLTTGSTTTGGSFTLANSPPIADSTTQTALYKMPAGAIPVNYTDANIVALWPASLNALNTPPSGGSGGAGTNKVGSAGNQASTPNGGIQGLVSLLPQFAQFTNRMAIALGNGYAPQLYSDATGTQVNPALHGNIATITVDAFGVVTVTSATPHGIISSQIGANVLIAGVGAGAYNSNGFGVNAFVIIAVPSTTTFKLVNLNAIGAGASSAGTWTLTSSPLFSTFTPGYPVWAASQTLSAGDIIVPATQPANAIYLTVIQGGLTGTVEPTWPTGGTASIGQHVQEGSPGTVVYTVSGLLNSAAPPPPGAAHIAVFSGALWVFNTSPTNSSTGLDGPCSLRQSSINNPNSWNPVNQAFLDKDDGTEGMSLAKFTITAQGIPPEGSLIAFKNFSPYQIIGVFGAANLQIQAVSSDMGCIAPRTTLFVPGFGIMRYSHLGVAVFNGVKDEIVSEQIRPYFFPTNNRNFSDITVVDANWVPVSWAALTANPPQYAIAMPIGNSGGQLTRIFPYDLVLKAWNVVDLPFAISSMAQVRSNVSNPLTIFGGFLDGVLQRWQAGDILWYTGGGANAHGVDWSVNTLTVASNDTDQRVYVRRLVVTGTNSGPHGNISVDINKSGVNQQMEQTFSVAPNADFDLDVAVGLTGKRFDARVYSGVGPPPAPVVQPIVVEIDGLTWETEPRPAGVVVGI